MEKSPDAFRTISEVADWLDIPTHVLRFWESRFSQIKPVKRAGGRRYYRPSDMRLIGGVKVMLHDQGMTIRAVQKALREQGIKHVSGFSPSLDGEDSDDGDVIDAVAVEPTEPAKAAPAPAARGTRSARPAPVVEPDPPEEVDDPREPELDLTAGLLDGDEDAKPEEVEAPHEEPAAEDAPVMFRRRPRKPVAEDEPAPEEAPKASEEAPAAQSAIPETPDVPANDPGDDDPAYARDPSVAARITAGKMRRLRANPEAVVAARDRLSEIRARLG